MSQILIVFNATTRQLTIEASNLAPTWADVIAAIASPPGTTVPLAGVAFGFVLRQNEAVLTQATYPPPGVRYVASDQPVLETARVTFPADTALMVTAWLTDTQSQSHNAALEFTSPPLPPPPEGDE